jgi:signal transduction histidine kinase/CheY-like chemotaxis protein
MIYDAEGNFAHVDGLLLDITDRKRAEAELIQKHNILEAIIRAQSQAIEESEAKGVFEMLLQDILKLTESEYGFIGEVLETPEGRPYLKTYALTNISWNEETLAFYREQAPKGMEFRNLDTLFGAVLKTSRLVIANDPANDPRRGGLPKGHPPLGSFLGLPLMSGTRMVGMLGIANRSGGYDDALIASLDPLLSTGAKFVEAFQINVKRRELEIKLHQAQRMEAVGRLAGGIAHDFNNLLTAIVGYSEMALIDLAIPEKLRSDIGEIRRAADRASSLTHQLLAFSRRQVLQLKIIDLNVVVHDVDKMLRRLIGEDIDLVTVLEEGIGRIRVDPGQIEQVIMNLAINARDAMPKGGKLTIETANVDLDEVYARTHVAVIPGPYVMLALSDNGHGMDAETQSRIFDPFFTTKEKGKGTGLGLSTVYGIVKQSGGNIWVYSEPGKGTTFKAYFPRVEEEVEAPIVAAVPVVHLHGTEVVLLVEDEEAVRKLAREILERNGYTVLSASEGEEAFAVSGRYAGMIHLLLTDVVMPRMGGRDLFNRLTPLRPRMKVLYMSGYTDNAVVHHGALDPGTHYLQKPFTQDGLLHKVREVLEETG